jgi:hypothetical protein
MINLSLQHRRESSDVKSFWIPAFAGMTLRGRLKVSNSKVNIFLHHSLFIVDRASFIVDFSLFIVHCSSFIIPTASNPAERSPSIWKGSPHGIDSPLRPSAFDHSPGIGFDKKSPFSPPGSAVPDKDRRG